MASLSYRLLDPTTIVTGFKLPREQVLDAGAYGKLQIMFRRLKDGTSATTYLRVQHAATNEDDAFVDLKDKDGNLVQISLDSADGAPKFVVVDNFTRFIRVIAVGTVTGAPVLLVDLVAK